MGNGIYTATAGAKVQSHYLDLIANNLANVGTVGYKADDLTFSDFLVQDGKLPRTDRVRMSEENDLAANTRERAQHFVEVLDQSMDLSQGAMVSTQNSLDVALDGPGFMTVELGGQTLYTRDGQFHLGPEGELLHGSGGRVLDEGGEPIALNDSGDLTIDAKGAIRQGGAEIARLGLVEIPDKDVLVKAGHTLFNCLDKDNPPAEASNTLVRQGLLEKSNVNPVREMTKMIKVNRHFEMMNKVIQAYRDLDNRSIQEVGNVSR